MTVAGAYLIGIGTSMSDIHPFSMGISFPIISIRCSANSYLKGNISGYICNHSSLRRGTSPIALLSVLLCTSSSENKCMMCSAGTPLYSWPHW